MHIQNSSQVKTSHEEDNAIHLHFCQLHWLLREEKQTIPTIQLKDKNVEQQEPRQLSNSSLLRGVRHDCTLYWLAQTLQQQSTMWKTDWPLYFVYAFTKSIPLKILQ